MTTRTFLAIDCAHIWQSDVGPLIDRLATPGDGVRWVRSENAHLTLKFFGNLDDSDLVAISRAVPRAVAAWAPFRVQFAGLGAFPRPDRPRTLWVGIGSGEDELVALQAAIDQTLEPLGYPPERRKFHPHLTIGRVRESRGQGDLVEHLGAAKEYLGPEVVVEEVQLVASHLRPRGPKYSVLSRFELAAPE